MYWITLLRLVFLLLETTSISRAIRIQSVAEVQEELAYRQKRATSSGVSTGNGVFGNQTLILTTACVRLDTNGIGISVREYSQDSAAASLKMVNIANGSTLVVTGACSATTADIAIAFSNLDPKTDVESATIRMSFTRDQFNWYLDKMSVDLSATFTNTTSQNRNATVISGQQLSTYNRGLFATLNIAYYCPNLNPLRSSWVSSSDETQVSIFFDKLAMQPFFGSTSSALMFSHFEGCEYAFSIGMWMAILAGIMMAIVVGSGIAMLAGISAPDRFSNPKYDKQLYVTKE